ncbi:hypothetical protein P22_3255 [Propionispora sp. 2/2-37]|jgi:hypothetical protein|uniref:hypothetical protein n=1 Tax=Propionispora sp. 2/2-37 TaxID=1677858 RepID=UPI0006BB8F36|nr:hypothetical protein [Propionispora sp. 2/2-37]CUH97129.1 hypothetical protein P22_3255 [Propionispora sp. 2/2-37]
MRKIDRVAAAFADLNHKIITDILARGYSPTDAETLATVRENLKVLKDFDIESDPAPEVPAEAQAKAKAGD